MVRLKHIKDKYAIERGFKSWDELMYFDSRRCADLHIDAICILSQKQALINASNSAELSESVKNSAIYDTIDKESIINENNLVK